MMSSLAADGGFEEVREEGGMIQENQFENPFPRGLDAPVVQRGHIMPPKSELAPPPPEAEGGTGKAGAWSGRKQKSESEAEDRTKTDIDSGSWNGVNVHSSPQLLSASPTITQLGLGLLEEARRSLTPTPVVPIPQLADDIRPQPPTTPHSTGLARSNSPFHSTASLIGAAPDSAGSTSTSFVGGATPTAPYPTTHTSTTTTLPITMFPTTIDVTDTAMSTTTTAKMTGRIVNTLEQLMDRMEVAEVEGKERERSGGRRPCVYEDVSDYDYVCAEGEEEKESDLGIPMQRRTGEEEEEEQRGEQRIRKWLEQQTGQIETRMEDERDLGHERLEPEGVQREEEAAARADSPVLGFGFDEPAAVAKEQGKEGEGEEVPVTSLMTSKSLNELTVPTMRRRMDKLVSVDKGRDKPLPLVPSDSPYLPYSPSLASLPQPEYGTPSNRISAILIGGRYPEHVVAREPDNSTTTASTPETSYTVPSFSNSSVNDTPLRTPDACAGYALGFGLGSGVQVLGEDIGSLLELGDMGQEDKEATITNSNKIAAAHGDIYASGSKSTPQTYTRSHSYSYSYTPYLHGFAPTMPGSNINSASHSRSSSLAASSPASKNRGLLPLGVAQQHHQMYSSYSSYSQGKSVSISRSNSSSASQSRRTSTSSGSAQQVGLTHFPAPPLGSPVSTALAASPKLKRASRLAGGVVEKDVNVNAGSKQPVAPALTTPTFATVSRTPSQIARVAARRRSEAQQQQKVHQASGSISSLASSSQSYSHSQSGGSRSRSGSYSYSSGGPSRRTSSSQLQQTMVLPDPKELSRRPSVQALQMRRSQSQLLTLAATEPQSPPSNDAGVAGVELVLSPASTASSTTLFPSASPTALPSPNTLHSRPRQTSSASLLSLLQQPQPQQLQPSTSASLLLSPVPTSPLPPSLPPTRRQSRLPSVSHTQVHGHEHASSVSSTTHTHSRGRSRAGSMTLSSLALSMRALGTKSSIGSLSSLSDSLSAHEDSAGGNSAHSAGEDCDDNENLEDDVLSVRNAVYIDSEEVRERLDKLLAMRSEVDLDEELELEFGPTPAVGVEAHGEIYSRSKGNEAEPQEEKEQEQEQVHSSAAAVKTSTMYQTPYGSSSQVYIGPGNTSSSVQGVAPNAIIANDTPIPANAVHAHAHAHGLLEIDNERGGMGQSQSDLCSLNDVEENVQSCSRDILPMAITPTILSTSTSISAPTSHGNFLQPNLRSGSTSSTNEDECISAANANVPQRASGFAPVSLVSSSLLSHVDTTAGAKTNSNGSKRSSSSSLSSSGSVNSGSDMSSVLGSYFLDNNSKSNHSHLDMEYFNSQVSNIDNLIFNGTNHDNNGTTSNNSDSNDTSVSASAGGKTAVAAFTGQSPTGELGLGALDSSCLPTPSFQHPFEGDEKSNLAASKINTNFASCSASGCGMVMNTIMPGNGNVADGEFFFDKMPVLASYSCSSPILSSPLPSSIPMATSIQPPPDKIPSTSISTTFTTTATDVYIPPASMSMPPENQHHHQYAPPQTHSRINSASSSRSSSSQSQKLTSSTTPTRPPPAPPLDMKDVAVAMDVALSPVLGAAVALSGTSSRSASAMGFASPTTVRGADEGLMLTEVGEETDTRQNSLHARNGSTGLGLETGMVTSADMSMLDVEETMTFARTELSDSDDDLDGLGLHLRGVGSAVGSGLRDMSYTAAGVSASTSPIVEERERDGEVEDDDYLSDDDGCASLLRGLDLKGRIAFPVREFGYEEDAAYVIKDGAGVVDPLALMDDNAGKLRLSMDSFAFGPAGYGHPQFDNIRPPMERSMSRWSLGSSDDGAEPESSRNSKETKKAKKDKKRNSRKSLVPSEDSGSRDLTSSFPINLTNGNPTGSVSGKESGVKKRGRLASFISRLSSVSGTGLQAPPNSSSSSHFQFEEGENVPPVPSTPLMLSSGMNSASASGTHTPLHTYTPADVLPPHTVVRGIWEATGEAGSPPPPATSFPSSHGSGINVKPSLASITTNTMRSTTTAITSKSVPSSPVNQRRPSLSKMFIPGYPPPPPPSVPSMPSLSSIATSGNSKAPSLKSPSMSNMKTSILLGKSSVSSIPSNSTKPVKAKPLSTFKSASEGLVGMLSGTFFSPMQAQPSIYVAGNGDASKRHPTMRGRSSSAADLLSVSSGGSRASRDQHRQYQQYQQQQLGSGFKVNNKRNVDIHMQTMPTSPTTPTRPSTPTKADADVGSRPSLVKSKSAAILRTSNDHGRESQSDHEHQLAYLDRSTDEGHSGLGQAEIIATDDSDDEDDEEEDYGVVVEGREGVQERWMAMTDEKSDAEINALIETYQQSNNPAISLPFPHVPAYADSWADDDGAPPVPPKEPASMPFQQQQPPQRPRLKSKTSIVNLSLITPTISSSSNSSSAGNTILAAPVVPPLPSMSPTPMSPITSTGPSAMKSKGFRGFVQRIGMAGRSATNGTGSSGPSTPLTATFAQSGSSSSIEDKEKEARSSTGSSGSSPSVMMNSTGNIATEIPLSPTLSRTQSKNMLLGKLSMPMPPLTHSIPSSAGGLPTPSPFNLNSPGPMSPLSPDSSTTTTSYSPVEEYNTTLETTIAVSATIPTSLLNPSLNQTKTLGLNMNISKPKKRKLLIGGVLPEDHDAVKRWCEAFGEIKEFKVGNKTDMNGKVTVSVDFKKRDVAETVCRLQKQVFIKGVGSVLLSWHTNKNDPAI